MNDFYVTREERSNVGINWTVRRRSGYPMGLFASKRAAVRYVLYRLNGQIVT